MFELKSATEDSGEQGVERWEVAEVEEQSRWQMALQADATEEEAAEVVACRSATKEKVESFRTTAQCA